MVLLSIFSQLNHIIAFNMRAGYIYLDLAIINEVLFHHCMEYSYICTSF